MLLLMLLGLVLIMVSITYTVRHPRAKGEAFSRQRKVYFTLFMIGAACVLIYALSMFMEE